ncbi:MAG TPA: ATP-binding cassette domain-containing protein, partial [Caulobacteraceae bacterium]|nr:ATP-binding cassette domain-containing protein [Caulobacteraceae bacterium]
AKAETKCLDLSGGERARLLLNMVAMDAPHLLILDEPTNHLDIDSRRALLDALNDFEGAVVIVTHDRSLMELVADRLWLTADGGVRPFDGDMDEYARLVLDRARSAASGEAKPSGVSQKDQRRAAAEARQRIAPLKKQVDAIEKQMEILSAQIGRLNDQLSDPSLFVKNAAHAAELGRERARAEEALASAEGEWMEAAEAYEAAKTEAGL